MGLIDQIGDPSSWVHQKQQDPRDSVTNRKDLRETGHQVKKGRMPYAFDGNRTPEITREPIQYGVQWKSENERKGSWG